MQESSHPHRSARITLRLFILFIAVIAIGTAVTWLSASQADNRLRENLLKRATWIAHEIDASTVRSVANHPADTSSYLYQHLLEELSQIQSFYPRCRTVYLLSEKNGSYYYLAEVQGWEGAVPNSVGDKFDIPGEDLLSNGTIGPYETAKGQQLTVLVNLPFSRNPLKLGMDFEIDSHFDLIVGAVLPPLLVTLVTLLILFLGTGVLRRSIAHSARPSMVGLEDKLYFYIAVTGIYLTALVGMLSHRWEAENRSAAFRQLAQDKISSISKSFHTLESVELEALARFFGSSEYVTPSEFNEYTSYLLDNPSVQTWQWVLEIPEGGEAALEREMHDLGVEGYKVLNDTIAGSSQQIPFLYPIVHMVSKTDNPLSLGIEFSQSGGIRQALEKAKTTGRTIASVPSSIDGVHDTIFLFRSVVNKGDHQNHPGFVSASFKLEDVLRATEPNDIVLLDISTGTHHKPNISSLSDLAVHDSFHLGLHKPILAFGQTYTVTAKTGPGFISLYPLQALWITLIAGTLITILLTILVYIVQRRHLILGELVQKRTEELHLERNRAEQAIQGADLGTWDWDMASNLITLNDNWGRMLGLDDSLTVLDSADLKAMVPKEMHTELEKTMEGHLRGVLPLYEMEHPFRHRDGHLVWVLVRGQAAHDDKGKPVRVSGTYLDITQRRQAESALLRSETHLRTLLDTLPDLVWLKDVDGVYISCNKKFERFVGHTEAQLMGKTDFDLFDRELAEFFRANDRAAIEANKPTMNEEEVVFPDDGHAEILETVKTPLHSPDGELMGVLGVARDISERKQAESEREKLQSQLVQAQKMEAIGRLAGGIAHDLNNLLVPMIGYSELLLDELDADDQTIESLESILNAGFRARDLVRQLLAFSRKQPLEFGLVDVNLVIGNFRPLLRRTIPEDIRILVNLTPDIKPIIADSVQIEQILMNLAVNAIDAMKGKGLLTIETLLVELDETYAAAHSDVVPGEYLQLSISDDGAGMDEATRERIFEPFFSTKGEQGTGLGLATVFGIVKQHGGDIWVYSELGVGTTFKVYLPVSSDRTIVERELEDDLTELRGSETILLVEDNNEVRRLVETTLRQYGYHIYTARSGENALELLKNASFVPDLLLSDVVMPGMNGRELYEELAPRFDKMKVLYMSGYTDDVIVHRGILEQGIHLLQKPFSTVALATKVRRLLENQS